jgi:hypothetical protein
MPVYVAARVVYRELAGAGIAATIGIMPQVCLEADEPLSEERFRELINGALERVDEAAHLDPETAAAIRSAIEEDVLYVHNEEGR